MSFCLYKICMQSHNTKVKFFAEFFFLQSLSILLWSVHLYVAIYVPVLYYTAVIRLCYNVCTSSMCACEEFLYFSVLIDLWRLTNTIKKIWLTSVHMTGLMILRAIFVNKKKFQSKYTVSEVGLLCIIHSIGH